MSRSAINSWIFHCSGLGGLMRSGADFSEICEVLRKDRRDNGLTRDDDENAVTACEAAEKVDNGLIIRIQDEKWRCVTDYLYGSINQFIVVTPTIAIVHPFPDMEIKLYDERKQLNLKSVHDMYYISERPEELVEFFKNFKR